MRVGRVMPQQSARKLSRPSKINYNDPEVKEKFEKACEELSYYSSPVPQLNGNFQGYFHNPIYSNSAYNTLYYTIPQNI